MILDEDRNIGVNGTPAAASSVGNLSLFNGTAPTGSETNGVVLYPEDVAASSVFKIRNESGDIVILDQQDKADHNNWAAVSDVVQALVDMGIFDAA